MNAIGDREGTHGNEQLPANGELPFGFICGHSPETDEGAAPIPPHCL